MSSEIIEMLALSQKPLVICDIDEVVLEFLDPFDEYLLSVDHRLHPDSFRLHGNIRQVANGVEATREVVDAFQETFFATQDRWQRPAPGAIAALERLAEDADIVFLTAMPPRHHDIRRQLLDMHALGYPMIATEDAKGPMAARLIGARNVPAAFIDDIYYNLHSVREHVPQCLLINLMANATFRKLAPQPGEGIATAESWDDAERLIRSHFAL